jgi:hypothetical protein
MRALKYAALGIVGFLLLLALPLLEFAFTLNTTALNSRFMVDEAEKLDVVSVGREIILAKLPPAVRPYMSAVDKTIEDNRPWIDAQIKNIIKFTYLYLEGKTDSLSITIRTDPIKSSLVENVLELYLPQTPEYQKLSEAEQKKYLSTTRDVLMEMVPSSVEINEDFIGADAMVSLNQMRGMISYFQIGYPGLIAFTLLLILVMIFIWREVRGATRSLGIIFFLGGSIGLIGYFIIPGLVSSAISSADMLPGIQTLIPGIAGDIIVPLQNFAIGLLGVGGVLIAVSFLFRPRQPVPISRPSPPPPGRYL